MNTGIRILRNGAGNRAQGGGADGWETDGFPSWKRAFDVICVLATIPVWLPVMLLIAVGIKAASPGCILFKQERVGYRGRKFTLLKFRSMKSDVETNVHEGHLDQLMRQDCPMTKLDASGDPRIIPLGRLLRASGMDELPQIFNVLIGDMSLVGPRPCTPHEFDLYSDWQKVRFSAPPGLTGYWQVNGKNKTTFSEMIAMDTYYASRMSIGLDVRIILKTIPTIARQIGEILKKRKRSNQGQRGPCSSQ